MSRSRQPLKTGWKFPIEKILDERTTTLGNEYLVQWQGYDESENKWIMEEDLGKNKNKLLADYHGEDDDDDDDEPVRVPRRRSSVRASDVTSTPKRSVSRKRSVTSATKTTRTPSTTRHGTDANTAAGNGTPGRSRSSSRPPTAIAPATTPTPSAPAAHAHDETFLANTTNLLRATVVETTPSILIFLAISSVSHIILFFKYFDKFDDLLTGNILSFAPDIVRYFVAQFAQSVHSTSFIQYLALAPYLLAYEVVRRYHPRQSNNLSIVGHGVALILTTIYLYETRLLSLESVFNQTNYLYYLSHITWIFAVTDLIYYCEHYDNNRRWQYTYIFAGAFLVSLLPLYGASSRNFISSILPAAHTRHVTNTTHVANVIDQLDVVGHLITDFTKYRLSIPIVQSLIAALLHVNVLEALKANTFLLMKQVSHNSIYTWMSLFVFLMTCAFGTLYVMYAASTASGFVDLIIRGLTIYAIVKNLVRANEETRWKGLGTPPPLSSKRTH